jgi:hypothetical protein
MTVSRKIVLYIEPSHHSLLKDQLFNIESCPYGGDQLLAPYVYLKEYLSAKGIEVHTADFMSGRDDGTLNLYVAISCLDNYRKVAKLPNIILSAFFPLECPVVEPSLYSELKKVQPYFKRIMTWSDSQSLMPFTRGKIEMDSFCWPQSFDHVHEDIWSRRDRNFLVIMNSNKLSRINTEELYTERLRAVEFFSRTGEIDLYGVGWNEPSYRLGKSMVPWTVRRIQRYLQKQWQRVRPDPLLTAARKVYRGRADSKPETLGRYQFAICFENMRLNGWITEKIFDCFFSGTIPIYWGPPNIEEFIPVDCFIDMRKYESYDGLKDYLKNLDDKAVQRYRENAREFLGSPAFRPFTKEAFTELFCRFIEEDAEIKLL